MSQKDSEYLDKLRFHAVETRTFLSNKVKPERERAVCRALLRALGVPFEDRELIAPTQEPADVSFRDARFQVRDLLRGRRRGDDWREKEQQYIMARTAADTEEPRRTATPITLAALVPEVAEALSEKSVRYGSSCGDVDALLYVDLPGIFLEAAALLPNTEKLVCQGWRSVSLLFPPYAAVLIVSTGVPRFLLDAVGTTTANWKDPDSLFEARA